MTDSYRQSILDLEQELKTHLDAANETKGLINRLCKRLGEPPRYPEETEAAKPSYSVLHGDEFLGKPLAAVVRTILEYRKVAGLGPATLDELYATMMEGGYPFEGREAISKRGLSISLAKNSQTFLKLANGKFSLSAWYPASVRKDDKNGKASDRKLHEEGDRDVVAVAVDMLLGEPAEAPPEEPPPEQALSKARAK